MSTPFEKMTDEWIEGGNYSERDIANLRDEVIRLRTELGEARKVIAPFAKYGNDTYQEEAENYFNIHVIGQWLIDATVWLEKYPKA